MASGTDPPIFLRTTREYDVFDRLTSDTTPLPDGGSVTVTYSYFANGTRKSLTDPAELTTSYTYDGQNRSATVTTDAGVTQYDYFPDGLPKQTTYPNGVTATHQYDRADRLVSLVNAHGEAALSAYTYTYDADGNRLSQIELNGGTTEATSYTYDDLNRLSTVKYPSDSSFPNGRTVSYAYDNVGNRVRETERDNAGVVLADKQGTFDAINRLTQLADMVDVEQVDSVRVRRKR